MLIASSPVACCMLAEMHPTIAQQAGIFWWLHKKQVGSEKTLPLCRFGLPEGRAQTPQDERQALFMLDSGAGGADAMMNFSSGTDLDLIDSKRESSISTTVRVILPAIPRHHHPSQQCWPLSFKLGKVCMRCLGGKGHGFLAAGS